MDAILLALGEAGAAGGGGQGAGACGAGEEGTAHPHLDQGLQGPPRILRGSSASDPPWRVPG